MKNILHLSDPNVYARYVNRYGVYGLFIQRSFPKNLTYGMKMFEAADGSIIAVEPGQIGGKEDDGEDLFIDPKSFIDACSRL